MESDTRTVLAVLDTLGVEYKAEAGEKAKICCPFHDEKTPSMTIFDNNSCYCFGCQRYCWHDELIAQIAGCSIIEAKKKLGIFDPNAQYIIAPVYKDGFKLPRIEFAEIGEDLTEHYNKLPTDVPQEMNDFLASKGLDGFAYDMGKWRWCPKGTLEWWPDREGICIPYFDPNGKVTTFRLRQFDRMRGRFGHPLAPKGLPLQASFMVFNKNNPVYFCEGESDSLSMRAIGKNVICLPGVGAHKQLHSAIMACFEWGIPKLVYCGDNDDAGKTFNRYATEVTMLLGAGHYAPQIRLLKLPNEYNMLDTGAFKRKDINDFFKEGRLAELITNFENEHTVTPIKVENTPVEPPKLLDWDKTMATMREIFGDGIEELPASEVEGIFD